MSLRARSGAVVLTLFVWGFAGALFGSLFAALYGVLQAMGLSGWEPLVIGAAAAAMTTSAFYSAMPVALVGAMAGVLASIGYLMVSGHRPELLGITATAAAAGVVAGGFYSWMGKGGRRSLAETLTGLLSGLTAGVLVSVGVALYGGEVDLMVMAAGVVAVVGSLFKISERWIVTRLSGRLPRGLSAPVVAGLIGAVVGSGVWIIGGAAVVSLELAAQGPAAGGILNQVPEGFLGGMMGGAVTGVVLELMGMHLEEDEHVV
jgi:hypothetical protein